MIAVQGVGSIMGGIMIMQAGKGNVEYVFTEKNFGQFASGEEVGKRIVNWQSGRSNRVHVLRIASADSCLLCISIRTEDVLAGQPDRVVA